MVPRESLKHVPINIIAVQGRPDQTAGCGARLLLRWAAWKRAL